MSLIRRRKLPGWGLILMKSTVGRDKGPKNYRKSLKTIKIINPISGKKINLNGPTHKRLIKEKVLDINGVDISRGVDIRTTKPISEPSSGDVIGNIDQYDEVLIATCRKLPGRC